MISAQQVIFELNTCNQELPLFSRSRTFWNNEINLRRNWDLKDQISLWAGKIDWGLDLVSDLDDVKKNLITKELC